MDTTDAAKALYDEKYSAGHYYWGKAPSAACFEVLRRHPPDGPRRLLDVGCGEGRNAVFFARNGYHVSAFAFPRREFKKRGSWRRRLELPLRYSRQS